MESVQTFLAAHEELLFLVIYGCVLAAVWVLHRWLHIALFRFVHSSLGLDLLSFARTPTLLVSLLAVTQATLTVIDAGRLQDFLSAIVSMGMIGAATWAAIRFVGLAERRIQRRRPIDVVDNLQARRLQTQVRVLARTADVLIAIVGIALMLMTIPAIRQLGTSLLASAGLAGLVAGLAARPVLSNLVAGIQIALTQPIRMDDVVIVQGEWGRIEEITSTYVVVRIWDDRRLVTPLSYFIEHPFENWTRSSSELLAPVLLWTDYTVPLEDVRRELSRICRGSPNWDGRVCQLDVVDATERALQIRALTSAADASRAWTLRCHVREELVRYLCEHVPEALPRYRARVTAAEGVKTSETGGVAVPQS
jgi:small-conductance mechanosensitive channel